MPIPLLRPTPPAMPIAPQPRLAPLPPQLGRDIFERLVPEQSRQPGVGRLNAAGISVPRRGFFDRELQAVKDNLFFALLFGVPAIMLGVAALHFVLFHVAFMTLYEMFKKED